MTYLRLLLISPLIAISSAAWANWGETRWDSSPEEVLAALGEGTQTKEDSEGSRVWDQHFLIEQRGEYQGFPVLQEFYFKKGESLSVVRINLIAETDCSDFVNAAQAQFDEPIDSEQSSFEPFTVYRWDFADREAGNVMRLANFAIGDEENRESISCHLIFQPFGKGQPGER